MRTLCVYVHVQDTPDATRPFLADITPSMVVFMHHNTTCILNLVPRDPYDSSEMCVRVWSLVTRLLTPTGFDVGCHLRPLKLD